MVAEPTLGGQWTVERTRPRHRWKASRRRPGHAAGRRSTCQPKTLPGPGCLCPYCWTRPANSKWPRPPRGGAMLCSARIGGAGSRSCAARPLSRWTRPAQPYHCTRLWMRGPCNGPTKRLKACGATRLAASRYLWRAVRPRMATCWRPSRKRCCSCTAEPASLRRLQERRTLQVREPTSPAECRALDQRGPAGGPHAGPAVCWSFPSRLRAIPVCPATRTAAESLARAVRAATELDARTTVLSIDGVGAYDHISRASMLSGLQHTPSLTALLPFVAQFYAEPSAYVFYDAEGAAHEIAQGEGGEQGDPLMPALYALGQHPALLQAHAALTPGKDLYAYLVDIYVTCQPERAGPAFTALGAALWERANIRVHLSKTRAWNAAGEEPSALLDALPAAARAGAWAGSWARPPAQQGITVLGTPGHAAYIAGALRRVREKHDELLGRIPTVPHLQSAWLLLLLCAQPRSNYLLRVLPPADTGEFAESHDKGGKRGRGGSRAGRGNSHHGKNGLEEVAKGGCGGSGGLLNPRFLACGHRRPPPSPQ